MSGAPPPPPPPLLTSTTSPPQNNRSLTVKTLSPSILIILLIVVVTVVASFSLCRILRCINNRFLRHVTPSSGDDASARASSRRVSPAESAAADPVAALPVFAFSSIKHRRASSTAVVAADCTVFLSKFEHDDQLRLLPLLSRLPRIVHRHVASPADLPALPVADFHVRLRAHDSRRECRLLLPRPDRQMCCDCQTDTSGVAELVID